MKKRSIILVILLVLILVVGVIVAIPLFSESKGGGGTQTDPTHTEGEAQEETEATNILPEVETEAIDGSVTDTGSFESDTGTGLEVHVDWSVFDDSEGSRKVRVDIYLNCYNLYVSERYNGITIRLGDETKTINSAAIDYTGSAASILIGSTIMDMPDDPTDCEVSWDFKGTYNGTELEKVTAFGTVG